jgi:hypothetical protein
MHSSGIANEHWAAPPLPPLIERLFVSEGDLNDAVTRDLQRHRAPCRGAEHGVRGSMLRSRTLHAAVNQNGRLANH